MRIYKTYHGCTQSSMWSQFSAVPAACLTMLRRYVHPSSDDARRGRGEGPYDDDRRQGRHGGETMRMKDRRRGERAGRHGGPCV